MRQSASGQSAHGDGLAWAPPKLVGASVSERDLYELLRSHVDEENALLETYRDIVTDTGAPDVGFLADLILEDEIRHHRLFEELAATLRSQVEMTPASAAGAGVVPDVPFERADSSELLNKTNELIALERTDQRRLRALRKELKPFADTTIWSVIIETIELDTKKHLVILRHLRKLALQGHP